MFKHYSQPGCSCGPQSTHLLVATSRLTMGHVTQLKSTQTCVLNTTMSLWCFGDLRTPVVATIGVWGDGGKSSSRNQEVAGWAPTLLLCPWVILSDFLRAVVATIQYLATISEYVYVNVVWRALEYTLDLMKHFTSTDHFPFTIVTRPPSNTAPLGCVGQGDSGHGCAADKSARTTWSHLLNLDQYLRGTHQTPCQIYTTMQS